MNKKLLKISVAGIVIGSLLLYMSFMGASGFGLSLAGTTFKEDFNAYPGTNGWLSYGEGVHGTPAINPAGQLELNCPTSGRTACMVSLVLPLQWTAEFRLKIDEYGGGTGVTAGRLVIGVYDTTYWVQLAIYNDHITPDGALNVATVTDNNWHVWTLVCSGSSTDIYRDSTKLATWQVIATSVSPKISLDGFGGTTTRTLVHFDYFYIDAGLFPPGGGSTYSLTVNAQSSGVSVPGTGPVASVGGLPFNVPHTWSLTSSSVTAVIDSSYSYGGGTYTFSQWDNGGTSNTRSGTLSAGSNTWTATYTAYTPPPNQYTVIVLTKDSNGAEFSGCQVTFNGMVKSSGSAIFNNVAAGSYSVSVQNPSGMTFDHWEDGSTVNLRSVYVSATVTYTAYFTGSGPGPWDPLAGLRNLLNNFTVRNYELIAGAVSVLLSSLLMVVALFVKKKTAASLPFVG